MSNYQDIYVHPNGEITERFLGTHIDCGGKVFLSSSPDVDTRYCEKCCQSNHGGGRDKDGNRLPPKPPKYTPVNTTRNFADVIRKQLEGDPELARQVENELLKLKET